MKRAQTVIIGVLSCLPMVVLGQGNDTLRLERDSNRKIVYGSFKSHHSDRKLSKGSDFLSRAHKASNLYEFRLQKQKLDELGMSHQTYQQYYQGIRVEGANYMLHGRSDEIETMNGNFEPITLKEANASLSESAALVIALGHINAQKYVWQDPQWEDSLKSSTKNPGATYFPKGELVIVRGTLSSTSEWRMAWKFEIAALEPMSTQYVWIDAVNGNILGVESRVCNSNVAGTTETIFSGTRNIVGDSFQFGYRLREIRNGVDVQTLNFVHNGVTYNWESQVTDFVDNDNNWTVSEHTNDKDYAAHDAHWGSEMILDYFQTVHSRNSLDGNGIRIRNLVHWGYNVLQAGWWSAPFNFMTYGDGINLPYVTLDITAHEMGHGIADFEAALGGTHEPGAINEGLSDIWAAVIENWAAPEKNGRWLLAEELGSPIRVMNNPKSVLYPNTYLGQYWHTVTGCTNPNQGNDWCGVHYNSAVLSYWFYLLSDGGSGTNDNGSCYTVDGIGISSAARVVYRAESYYVNSSTNYSGIRNSMIQAATDLYGSDSHFVSSVTNAWYAVGIGSAVNTSGDIVGTTICSTASNVTLTNSSQNVTWSVTPTNLFVNSSGTGNSATLQAITGKVSGAATITFTPTTGCGVSSNAVSKMLWVGKPQNNFSGPTTVYPDQIYTYSASDPYTSNWVWTLSPGVGDCGITYGGNCFFGSGGGGQSFTIVWMHESGYVRMQSSNSCGLGPQKSLYVTVSTQGGCNPCQISSIYPNPSSSELNIKLILKDDKGKQVEPTEIKIIDSYQMVLYSTVVTEPVHKIQTSGLPDGVYYVVVTNSQGTETKRVVIGH